MKKNKKTYYTIYNYNKFTKVGRVQTMKTRKHTNKLYYTTKGRVYFNLFGVRYYIDELTFDRETNAIGITISNCLGYNLEDIEIDDDTISYYLRKWVL